MYFFFFNDTATTEIYTLSLHDALPISRGPGRAGAAAVGEGPDPAPARARAPRPGDGRFGGRSGRLGRRRGGGRDRKSTRLNSSHANISYAVFCLKKKKNIREISYKL